MNKSLLPLALVALLSLPLSSRAALLYKGPELDSLPEAVQKTIKKQARHGHIRSIEETMEHDDSLFTVEFNDSEGAERIFVVAEDGTLTRLQVPLEQTPAAVQKTIRAQLGGGTLIWIDKMPDEPTVEYDVEMTKEGRDRSIIVAEDGTLSSMEIYLEEAPPAVQKAIRARLGSGRLGDIYKVIEDGEVSYEVSMTRHRKSLPFTLDANGQVMNAIVLLEEAPAAVQKTVRAKIAEGHLDEVLMSLEDGRVTYQITYTTADEAETFEVTGDGKIVEELEGVHKTSI